MEIARHLGAFGIFDDNLECAATVEEPKMRLLAFAALLAAAATPALAAEPFNILGTWIPVSHAAARIGTTPSGAYGTYTKPSLVRDKGLGWNYTFDKQDGAAFSGISHGPKGKPEMTVGVFRMDGRRFVLSTDSGNASGEVNGDEIEICWTDNVPNYIAASCTTYERK